MYFSDQWLINYGWAYQSANDFQKAIEKYEIAEKYTSDPELLMDMAFCYAKLKYFDKALQRCSTAMYIVPNRIYPKYGLMNIYLEQNDSIKAIKMAKIIVVQTPKGISKDAAHYKEKANELLNKH